MLDKALSLLAPHICSGCGKSGTLLCDNCKYDIVSEPFVGCISCGKDMVGINGICRKCNDVPYQRAWCVADRRDQVQRLIGNYKFTNAKAAYISLSDLLDAHLPELPANVVIVPVPTVNSHIRQRGYDHMLLIAQRLAKARNLGICTDLIRATNTKQRSANAKERITQAKRAFTVRGRHSSDNIYLLIDDVVTTGATLRYASKALLDSGAGAVWVASISRQTMDSKGRSNKISTNRG